MSGDHQLRVLVVKIGAIGDVIMALSMVTAIRKSEPSAHISWMVGEVSRPILELTDGIDELIVINEHRLFRGGQVARIRELVGVWRRVFGRRFDLIVTGHSDWRYRLLTLPAAGKIRRAFRSRGRMKPIADRYFSNEYSRMVSMEDGPGLAHAAYPAPRGGRGAHVVSRSANQSVVVLAPGGARNAMRDSPVRRWPVASYRELAERLIACGCRVLLIGGPGDLEVSAQFAAIGVTDLIGKTSLRDLAAVIAESDLVVTHDSLALHMSVWLNRRVLALFGPTSPLQFCPPQLTEVVRPGRRLESPERPIHVLWGGGELACRPCYDGREFHACPQNICMQDIRVDEVALMVEDILRQPTAPQTA